VAPSRMPHRNGPPQPGQRASPSGSLSIRPPVAHGLLRRQLDDPQDHEEQRHEEPEPPVRRHLAVAQLEIGEAQAREGREHAEKFSGGSFHERTVTGNLSAIPHAQSGPARREFYQGRHRFERWYRDNTVYFITARCRDRYRAFESEAAKCVFWDRFDHYTKRYGFEPDVSTLLDNHYHTLGYFRYGTQLGEMMRRIHPSVAKLVNDLLPERRVPFWWDRRDSDYFDGCIRDELQYRRSYRYTLTQSVRRGVCRDYRDYPHTRVGLDLETGLRRALAQKAFLPTVPYKRYERRVCPPPPIVHIDWEIPDVDLELD
jgi:hypothetical protein